MSVWGIWQSLYETGEPAWLRTILNPVLVMSWVSPIWAPVLFGILTKKRHGRILPWRGLLLVLNTAILFPLALCMLCDAVGVLGARTLGACFLSWLTIMVMFILMLLWRGRAEWLLLANIPILGLILVNVFGRTTSFALAVLGVAWLGLTSLLLFTGTRRRPS